MAKVTIQDLIDHLNKFPKNAVICTHNSHSWYKHKVTPISEDEIPLYIREVEEPINDNCKPLKGKYVSIYDYRQVDY